MVIGVPVPPEEALEREEVEAWVAQALIDADSANVHGKRITPFLLNRLAELSGGKTLSANIALLENNAATAAHIAVALSLRD
jgi:pseudouridine-5'-phosphate glycosidase